MSAPAPAPLVLASTSPYRRELLSRLKITFDTASPNLDETPFPDEQPQALALRLAQMKARCVKPAWPTALIIGSDQVAVVDGVILDKPGTHARASDQLALMRGKAVHFHTAVCLLNAAMSREQTALVTVIARMRDYDDDEIERYLRLEQPYDCAGSARIEGLGIAMVQTLTGDDPTALIGLPLIALCDMLRTEGVELP